MTKEAKLIIDQQHQVIRATIDGQAVGNVAVYGETNRHQMIDEAKIELFDAMATQGGTYTLTINYF